MAILEVVLPLPYCPTLGLHIWCRVSQGLGTSHVALLRRVGHGHQVPKITAGRKGWQPTCGNHFHWFTSGNQMMNPIVNHSPHSPRFIQVYHFRRAPRMDRRLFNYSQWHSVSFWNFSTQTLHKTNKQGCSHQAKPSRNSTIFWCQSHFYTLTFAENLFLQGLWL